MNHIMLKHPEFKSNLLNINITTPHPKKALHNKKRKLDSKTPEIEDSDETIEQKTKVETKDLETQTENVETKEMETQTDKNSIDYISDKLKTMTEDRDKWQNSCLEGMNKLQASEIQNVLYL